MKSKNIIKILVSSNIALLIICILLIFSNIKLKNDTLIHFRDKVDKLMMVNDSIYTDCQKTESMFKSRGLLAIIVDESHSTTDSIAFRPLISSVYDVLDSLERNQQLPTLRIYEYQAGKFVQIYSELFSGPFFADDKSSIIKFKRDMSINTKEFFFIFDFPDSSLFCTSDLFAYKVFFSNTNKEINDSGHLEEFLEKFSNYNEKTDL